MSETGATRASYGYKTLGETDDELTGELKPGASGPTNDPSQFLGALDALNTYRYTGKRLDTATGQLDMGARRLGRPSGSSCRRTSTTMRSATSASQPTR